MSDVFRERETDFDPVMTAEEALMWRVGADPWLDPSGGLLVILDQPIDIQLMRRKLAAGVSRFPRMAEKVTESANPLEPPRWELDPHFDLATHVVEVSVAAPGDHRALLDLTAELMAEPFPAERPPWIIFVIHGLSDGRCALLSRLHHAVADGIGSLRMAEIYIDLERTTVDPGATDLAAFLADRAAERPTVESDPTDAVLAALLDGLGMVKSAAAEMALIGADPARASRAGNQALDTLRTVIDQLAGDPYLDSSSELWAERSGHRYFVTAQMPLDAAKLAAKRRGGTINDLYVTALADAALDYHAEKDEEPRSIAMSFVRSTREGSNAGGNAFVPVKVRAPGRGTAPDDRFTVLQEAMRPPENELADPGLGAVSSLAAMIPTAALTRLGREQGSRIDVVTSNLRGAPVPLFIGGAKVEASFPIGPVAGAACNATVMSYDGSLDIGIMIDPAAIDDPDRFGEIVQAVLDGYASEVASKD